MAERRTMGEWFRANWVSLAVPIASGIIALGVAYGADQRDNAILETRVAALEASKATLEAEVKELRRENNDLENQIDDRSDEIEDLVIREGRDLERQLIRLGGRVDAIGRRIAFLDGISAPTAPSAPALRSFDSDLLAPFGE